MAPVQPSSFDVPGSGAVAALHMTPPDADTGYVFAHGAGAGMDHAFMSLLSEQLAQRRVATLRFQFPYMQQGSKRPDTPAVAQAAVRAAVGEARRLWPALPLFAGGKSFGGRMASQAQAASPLEGVRGLVFVGFPLHLAGKPSVTRAAHLAHVKVPMLFLQGTRDALAELTLLQEVLRPLKQQATLALEDDADHAFHVRVRSGRTDEQVLASLADRMAAWCAAHR